MVVVVSEVPLYFKSHILGSALHVELGTTWYAHPLYAEKRTRYWSLLLDLKGSSILCLTECLVLKARNFKTVGKRLEAQNFVF